MGRPKLPDWRRRDYELRIKLDRLERLFLAEQCGPEGESLSEYVRRLINREIAKQPPEEVEEFDDVSLTHVPVLDHNGEVVTRRYRDALKERAANMTAEELEARVADLLDYSEYDGGEA